MEQLKIWLLNEGENLPGDDDNARLQRMGLLAYELDRLGANVTWWHSTFNHAQKKFRCYEDKDIQLTDDLKLKLIHSCGYKKNVCVRRMVHERKTAKRFYKIAKNEESPDVIVAAMPTIALAHIAIKYGKKHNVPVLIDVRDLQPDGFVVPFHGIMKRIISMGILPLKSVLGYSLKNAAGLIGTTEPYLNWGLNYAKRQRSENDRVYYVSYPDHGMLDSLSENSKWSEYLNYPGIICCFFGQFANMADIDTVLAAAELTKKDDLDVVFLLCGMGELLEHYKEVVKEKQLYKVKFPGWVNQTDIREVGFVSDAGLMPYKKDKNFELQMPNKFSEYLSLGLTILLQPTGIMKDVIDKNKCGVHYKTPEELHDILKDLLLNRDKLEQMKVNSRQLFEQEFSAGKVYEKYGQYIMKMAEESRK